MQIDLDQLFAFLENLNHEITVGAHRGRGFTVEELRGMTALELVATLATNRIHIMYLDQYAVPPRPYQEAQASDLVAIDVEININTDQFDGPVYSKTGPSDVTAKLAAAPDFACLCYMGGENIPCPVHNPEACTPTFEPSVKLHNPSTCANSNCGAKIYPDVEDNGYCAACQPGMPPRSRINPVPFPEEF